MQSPVATQSCSSLYTFSLVAHTAFLSDAVAEEYITALEGHICQPQAMQLLLVGQLHT